MRAVIAVAACALALPGCGGGGERGAERPGRLSKLGTEDGGRRWKATFRP